MKQKQFLLLSFLILVFCIPVQAQDIKTIRQQAEEGDKEAQYELGIWHLYNDWENGTDTEKGLYWLTQSACQGNVQAQYMLGDFYEENMSEVPDTLTQQAFYWYHKAAEQGNVQAQHSLGTLYYWTLEGKENREKGMQWLLQAAENGSAEAELSIGLTFFYSETYDEAYPWLEKAARTLPEAQFLLGTLYLHTQWAGNDVQKAIYWIEKAAHNEKEKEYENEENLKAWRQYRVARLYRYGPTEDILFNKADYIPFPTDIEKAIEWYLLAAENENCDAQYELAGFYEEGSGVQQNNEKALYWYRRSAANGSKPALWKISQLEEKVQISGEETQYPR